MKRILLATFLIAIAVSVSANSPLILYEDSIIFKQQVEYCSPEYYSESPEWDFTNLNIINEAYEVQYCQLDSADPSIRCCVEHNARYYYFQSGDTLYLSKYEDNIRNVDYLQPIPQYYTGMNKSDTLSGIIHGRGTYGHLLPMHVNGHFISIADAEGALILPNASYNKALRVHTHCEFQNNGIDGTRMSEDNYRWYIRPCPRPVFESVLIRTFPIDSLRNMTVDTIVYTSFFYQTQEIASIEHTNDAQIENDDSFGSDEGDRIFANARFLPNPVIDDLQIVYSLSRDAHVGYFIHSSTGLPLYQQQATLKVSGEHTDIISMRGFMHGTYTLYIIVDNYLLQKVIIKQ